MHLSSRRGAAGIWSFYISNPPTTTSSLAPLGERGPPPALSPAGAGRVRGSKPKPAQPNASGSDPPINFNVRSPQRGPPPFRSASLLFPDSLSFLLPKICDRRLEVAEQEKTRTAKAAVRATKCISHPEGERRGSGVSAFRPPQRQPLPSPPWGRGFYERGCQEKKLHRWLERRVFLASSPCKLNTAILNTRVWHLFSTLWAREAKVIRRRRKLRGQGDADQGSIGGAEAYGFFRSSEEA